MNPEVKKSENSSNSEWDSVSEIEFSGENTSKEEKKSEALDFAEKFYKDNFYGLIERSCFEGGDKAELDNYVHSISLEQIVPDEEQSNLIKSFSKGEPLSPEIIEKATQKLSRFIENSSIKDEIIRDPYLRKEHADALAGRYTRPADSPDYRLAELLWNFDNNFYNSGAAFSLLFDQDYIKLRYGSEMTEDESKKVSEDLDGIIKNNEATIEEILNDNHLRRKRFEMLGKNEETSSELEDLWWRDTGFYDSWQYQDELHKKKQERPEIYLDLNEEEITKIFEDVFNKIPEKKYTEIIKAYEKDLGRGDRELFDTILPALGLENNPPSLEYGTSSEGEYGYYQRHKHRIVICEESLEKKGGDSSPVLAVSSFFDRFRPKKLEDKIFRRINTVAHETWHAHQWIGEGVPDERREMYRENFIYYARGRNGYESYRSQLIEDEAFRFGSTIETRCEEAYKERGGKYEH